jgi:hypothetical protein
MFNWFRNNSNSNSIQNKCNVCGIYMNEKSNNSYWDGFKGISPNGFVRSAMKAQQNAFKLI